MITKKQAILAVAVAVAFVVVAFNKGVIYALFLVLVGATIAVVSEGLTILIRWTQRTTGKRGGKSKTILPTRAKRSDR